MWDSKSEERCGYSAAILCALASLALIGLGTGCNRHRGDAGHQALSGELKARADSTEVHRHWVRLDDHYERVELPAPWDAYLTWKGYDGLGDKQRAVYLWNGKEMGRGDEGFLAVLGEWEKLPPYSVILIFPAYHPVTTGADFKSMPFGNSIFERETRSWTPRLQDIIVRRHLLLVLSDRNLEGNPAGQ